MEKVTHIVIEKLKNNGHKLGEGFLELVFGYLEIYFAEVTELYFTFYHKVGFIFYYFNSAFQIVFGGMAKIVYCINA